MKKFILLAMAITMAASCSDDDSKGKTPKKDSFSAHMKTECPQSTNNQFIWDVCVSEAVWWDLDEQRNATEIPNSCLKVEFEDINGTIVKGYLIRVEKNVIDCK